jgi:hypothetical protein
MAQVNSAPVRCANLNIRHLDLNLMFTGKPDSRCGCCQSDWHTQYGVAGGRWPGGKLWMDEQTRDRVVDTQVGDEV